MSQAKKKKARNTTIRDVAREADASVSTVSRYLNGASNISKETSHRIAVAMRKLHYMPNAAARSLRGESAKMVLLIVPDISNPFYSQIVRSVQWLLNDHGYSMLLFDSNGSLWEESAVETAQRMSVKGILMASLDIRDSIVRKLQNLRVPVVLLNSYEPCPFDSVFGDLEQCMYMITQHFITLGHKRIAFAGGSPGYVHEVGRRKGYERAMREAGLTIDPQYEVEIGFSQSDGYECGRLLAVRKPLPTAVCCANDLIALGLMSALHEHGISIPEEVSVAGVDNIPYDQISWPSLTSVTNDGASFARDGVRMLLERIENTVDCEPRSVVIRREFIIRDSVAPCKENY